MSVVSVKDGEERNKKKISRKKYINKNDKMGVLNGTFFFLYQLFGFFSATNIGPANIINVARLVG